MIPYRTELEKAEHLNYKISMKDWVEQNITNLSGLTVDEYVLTRRPYLHVAFRKKSIYTTMLKKAKNSITWAVCERLISEYIQLSNYTDVLAAKGGFGVSYKIYTHTKQLHQLDAYFFNITGEDIKTYLFTNKLSD